MHILKAVAAIGLTLMALDAVACGHCRDKEREAEARRHEINRERRPAKLCGKVIVARSSPFAVGNPCETSASFKTALNATIRERTPRSR